ncbi:MAG: mercury resistance system transport protein MerF [Nitrospira sp.]|nr:mercury resistance system transport protein MerF [Candidatus Manganitrophaceae bacterium]HIL34101.1 mercury resistance system transport protein MerF [Candidatus Manganitrophaceae bacterium]
MAGKSSNGLLKVGLIGSVVAAVCCFTPVLVIGLSAVGFAVLIGYLDYVLLPALVIFIGITVYAMTRRNLGVEHGENE